MPRSTLRQAARGCIVVAVLLGAFLRVLSLANVEFRTPDEVAYTAQAAALRDGGLPGLQRLVTEYVDDPNRFLPAPSRIGYTGPIADLMALTGRSDALVGALSAGAL